MHLSEGILSVPVLAGGGALAAAGIYIGLRAMRDEDIPKVALLTAAFFVASLIHVPIGPSSAHLVLNGMMGLLLGWAAFPSVCVALILQAVLFQHGGLTVLGVNTIIMAAPAALIGLLLRPLLTRSLSRQTVWLIGAGAGVMGIVLGALLAATALAMPGRAFFGVAGLFLVAQLPVMAIEGVLTGTLVVSLWRLEPHWLTGRREPR